MGLRDYCAQKTGLILPKLNKKTADKLRGGAYLPKMRGSITKFINTMGEWYL